MRPPPPVIIPQPHSSFTSNSLPSTSSNSNLNISLTIRHLPTDTWRTFTVPTEFRISDIKRLALETFEEDRSSSDSKSLSKRRGKASSSREDSQEEKENLARSSKGKETKLSGDSLLSVAGSEKEKKSGGVRRFTNALRDRLSSRDLNAISTSLPPRPTPSPLRSTNASLSSANPLPSRHSLSTTPTPTSASFALSSNATFDTPTRQRVRKSEDTHSRRSSMANFDSLNLLTGRKKESMDVGEEREVLVSFDDTSPTTTRRLERSRSLSEKNKSSSTSPTDKSVKSEEIDEKDLSGWTLVNAVTGGAIADHAIVGSKLVDNDILTLKPHNLFYDPPLHLYHLPYQHLSLASILPASLSTCRTTFDLSSSKGHSRRKSSVGGRYKQEELVERRIEICVDDGVYAAAQGVRQMTPGTTMVLKVIKINQVEAIYSLPPSSIQVVASSQAPVPSPSLPPMPHSSSTTSFAALMLPSGPSSITPPPASSSQSSRKKTKSPPLIQLGWEEGESLVLRAANKEDQERLMRILGEVEPNEEEKDEKERQGRKDLIDLAFASRHHLLDLPFISTHQSYPARSQRSTSSQRPPYNRALTSHSLVRPALHPRSASASLVPPAPRVSSRHDQTTPKRSSSILHIKKRESSLDFTTSDHTRSSTSTSTSTFSDSPATPTSLTHPEQTSTKTMITPATPHSHSYSPSSTNPSPASLMSSSSSYFSLHSPPLVLPPFSYSRIPSSSSFTRAKSSLDLTSSLRSGSSLVSALSQVDTVGSGVRRKVVRRATSNLDGLSQVPN